MKTTKEKMFGSVVLLIAAIIWGGAIVSQIVGADYVGKFTFNGCRMLIGAIVLVPVSLFFDKRRPAEEREKETLSRGQKALAIGSIGTALFVAANFQQLAIEHGAESGKAGFITALYIVLVPLVSLLFRKRPPVTAWVALPLALGGLYLVSIHHETGIEIADIYLLCSACCYTAHIILIGHFSPKMDGVKLSIGQFSVCAALCFVCALIFETIDQEAIRAAALPLLYAGVCSCGIGYTLQVIGQKHTDAATASIIMGSESVFALLAGVVFLHQIPTGRDFIGFALMLSAILLTQLPEEIVGKIFKKRKKEEKTESEK